MISVSQLSYICTSSLLLLGRQIWDNLSKSNSYWDSIQSWNKISLLIFIIELIQSEVLLNLTLNVMYTITSNWQHTALHYIRQYSCMY